MTPGKMTRFRLLIGVERTEMIEAEGGRRDRQPMRSETVALI